MKSLNAKLSVGVLATILVAGAMLILVTSRVQLGRERALLTERARSMSELLVRFLSFAMDNGVIDVHPLEEQLGELEGVVDFRVVPAQGVVRNPRWIPTEQESAVLGGTNTAPVMHSSEETSETLLVLSSPILATSSCLRCHPGVGVGSPLAVATLALSTGESERSVRLFVQLTAGLVVAACVLIIGGVVFSIRSLAIRPLKHLRDVIHDVAEGDGDLTRRLQLKRGDEIGEAAHWFDVFLEQIHGIIRSLKQSGDRNLSIAGDLSATAEQTLASVSSIRESIDQIQNQFADLNERNAGSSAAVEEILATIGSLAGRIDEQASAVAETSAAIEEMVASIDSVAKIAGQRQVTANELRAITTLGGEKVGSTNELIREISVNVDDMLQMIDLINNIASQTNLLSMNAAIEAAHAGDAGRGFSVVADEIRKLAESTSENAKGVSSTLNSIVEKIGFALRSSTDSGEAFDQISGEVRGVVDAFSEITNGTAELAQGSQEVLTASQALLQISEHIRSNSNEMRVGAQSISEDLTGIKEISSQALERIRSIRDGVGKINDAMNEISGLSEQNRDTSQQLESQFAQFRTRGD